MSDIFQPEITLLYCGCGLADGEYLPEGAKKVNGFKVRFVMMSCSCKVESGYLLKLIEGGTDGVMLVVCPKEECQFMIGSARAENRVRYTQSLLEEVGMDRDRLAFIEGINLAADKYFVIARSRADALGPLGPNPMKVVGQAA